MLVIQVDVTLSSSSGAMLISLTLDIRIRKASLIPLVALARIGLGSIGLDDVTVDGDVIVAEVASVFCD